MIETLKELWPLYGAHPGSLSFWQSRPQEYAEALEEGAKVIERMGRRVPEVREREEMCNF